MCRLAAVVALLAMAGCGAGPVMPEGDLYREASLALEDESYTTAISSYKKLLEEYPFSDKAEIAAINIAFAHYLNNEYNEAIVAFNDFERLYPVSPLLPFVSYTIGMCWLDQARDGERDPSPSDEALRQFKKVASEFPNTLYADLSIFREQEARENLAAHELVVGDYYRERKRLDAAEGRYKFIISEYPTTENASRAAERLKDVEVQVASSRPEKPDKPGDATTPNTSTPSTAPLAPAPVTGDASPASGTPPATTGSPGAAGQTKTF
jgi:outer membrane protein assembly factor BamD